MTVGELKDLLAEYNDDQEVMIAMFQKYGCDFAYSIYGIRSDLYYEGFYEETEEPGERIFLVMGSQDGTVSEDED